MPRLFDRIVRAGGCRPLDAYLVNSEGYETSMRASWTAMGCSEDEIERLWRSMADHPENRPRGETSLGLDAFEGAQVIAADEIFTLTKTMIGVGTEVDDLVSVLVPPFWTCFIEFQGVGNPLGWKSWGYLVTRWHLGDDPDDDFPPGDSWTREDVGWVARLELVVEPERGPIMGPLVRYEAVLDHDGQFLRQADGRAAWLNWLEPEITATGKRVEPHSDTESAAAELAYLLHFAIPALMTLTFLNCKNVKVERVTPPKALDVKARRETGHHLVRFHTLDVVPMRKVLETQGQVAEKGIRHALHVCRGHFKTYTEDAPLFGRHAGTYYWEETVRGSGGRGIVTKDYEVHGPAGPEEIGK